MYQVSADQGPSKRGRSRPRSQSRQSHIEDTLTLKPPGITNPIRFPFPDRKLPVCATCKRNYKTRELCRTRDGHTGLPWTTTYICITLDDTCVNDKGEFYRDATFVARPTASHKHYCFSRLQTVEVPICLACKEKNYTRQYCREKLKHRQLPWATAFAILSNAGKHPSKIKEGDGKERGTSEGKPLKRHLKDVSGTSPITAAIENDGLEQNIGQEDRGESPALVSRKIGHTSAELNSEEESGLVGKPSGSNKISWQSDSGVKGVEGASKSAENLKIKLEDVSVVVAKVDQKDAIEWARDGGPNRELMVESQGIPNSDIIKGFKENTSNVEVQEDMGMGSVLKQATKLEKKDSNVTEIEYKYAHRDDKVDTEKGTAESVLAANECKMNDNLKQEEKAEEQMMYEKEKSEFCVIDSKSSEIDTIDVLSKLEKRIEHTIESTSSQQQKSADVTIDPDSVIEEQLISSKRSADSEASCTSPPQKVKLDDEDVNEGKAQDIFGTIHESRTFLAVVSSKFCSFDWLDNNPDRDKSTRSFSKSPVSSPISQPQDTYASYPYYPQPQPHHTAAPYYAPHQYDYSRWAGYGYPPAQPYTMPQAHPHWTYYPYYEHDGGHYPPPEHGGSHFGPPPPQHPGPHPPQHPGPPPPQHPENYDQGHPSHHSSNSYSEPPHPQYFAHPAPPIAQHNQYPVQQEGLSHDTQYQDRPQDQYQSQEAQPPFSEGTPNVASQPQDQHQQSPPSPRDQGGYYYPSHPNRTPDRGDQWQR